jgi:hypothetical protein
MCYNKQDRIGCIGKEGFGMAFISAVYGFVVHFAAWWASIDIFFRQLFGA